MHIPPTPRGRTHAVRLPFLSSCVCLGAALTLGSACSSDDAPPGGATTATTGGVTTTTGTNGNTTSGLDGGTTTGTTAGDGGTTGGDAQVTADAGTTGDGGDGGTNAPPACDPSAAPPITRLGLDPVVPDAGTGALVYAAQPPGSDDWYLLDLLGKIMVWTDGDVWPTPFLDLTSEISLSGGYDERGMLGMTFAPDYETSGKMYVTLVPTTGDDANHDLLLEYTRSADDPYVVDPASRRAIVDLPPGGQSFLANNYHNGNTVMFGPDGMLYYGMGDGGGDCNSARPGAPQDVGEPYGKIMRLDPSAAAPYAAADNPFASDGDPRVYHYGVRNPFRFGFDSVTGDLYIGDVGQWNFEEISFAPAGSAGLNFGWPDFEADDTETCPDGASLRAGSEHTLPIHTIAHGSEGGVGALVVSVVGGTVYRGSAIPELYGAYLWGEYYANRPMGALYQCDGTTSPTLSIRKVCDPNFPDDPCFLSQNGAAPLAELGAIVEGNDGELYLAANNNALLKIVPAQ